MPTFLANSYRNKTEETKLRREHLSFQSWSIYFGRNSGNTSIWPVTNQWNENSNPVTSFI